jgi:hypothetical protein
MTKSKTIEVTPNVEYCLEQLKEAVKSMSEGDLKDRAEGALDYLSRTFEGEPQPAKGISCPGGRPVVQ